MQMVRYLLNWVPWCKVCVAFFARARTDELRGGSHQRPSAVKFASHIFASAIQFRVALNAVLFVLYR